MQKIVKRASGELALVAHDYSLADGEAWVSADSEEGLAFLEDEVARQERATKSSAVLERLGKMDADRKTAGQRQTAPANAGRQGGGGLAVLDGDGVDDEHDADDGDAGVQKREMFGGFAGEARQGMGLTVYNKLTDQEARGGTKHFAEFLHKLTTDPAYKADRQRRARAFDLDLYQSRLAMQGMDFSTRALAEGTTSAGGALVPPQYIQELLDLARAEAVAFQAGVKLRTTNSNIVNMPTLTTAATAAWVAENGAITPTDEVFGQQTMTMSKLASGIKISNEMIADADPAIIEVVMQDMAKVIALALDLGIFEGSGSAPVIRGIANTSGTTAGPSLGANGATPTLDNLYDTFYNLYAANIVDEENWSWVFHPRVINTLRKIKDTTNNYILSAGQGVNAPIPRPRGLLGVPYFMSSQLSITRTVGTSTDCTNVYVGRWSDSIVFANGAFTIDVSNDAADATNSGFWSDQTWIRAKQRLGFLVRRPAALAVITGVRP